MDDETVLQKTVGQDGESPSVGWCEAEHYVAKPERHMNGGQRKDRKSALHASAVSWENTL